MVIELQDVCNDIAFDHIEEGDVLQCVNDEDIILSKKGDLCPVYEKDDVMNDYISYTNTSIKSETSLSKIKKFSQVFKNLGKTQKGKLTFPNGQTMEAGFEYSKSLNTWMPISSEILKLMRQADRVEIAGKLLKNRNGAEDI